MCYYCLEAIFMEKVNLISQPDNQDASRSGEVVLVGRHFDDVDDLTNGLDTSLKPLSPETQKVIESNADIIISDTETKNFNKILIVSSPRKRALLTSSLLKEAIKEKRSDFSVQIRTDERFTELSHGEIILPEDYSPGRRIEFLKDAWGIFWSETFTEDGNYNNPNYHFGDSVKMDEGNCKYPEIDKSFASSGESYRELSQRYYEAIVEYLENKKRVENSKINVVLIAHSATLAILTELQSVALDMVNHAFEIKTGDLMKICWQRYLKRLNSENDEIDFGELKSFTLENLDDKVLSCLKQELDFIKKTENYDKKV